MLLVLCAGVFTCLQYIFYYPNPDIEMRLIVQVVDVPGKVIKTVTTSLVIRLFMNFPGILRTCASIVFSISGFGIQKENIKHWEQHLI